MPTPSIPSPSRARPINARVAGLPTSGELALRYRRSDGLDTFIKQIRSASVVQSIELDRYGVSKTLVVDLCKRMEVAPSRLAAALKQPDVDVTRFKGRRGPIKGAAGLSVIAILRLLGVVQELLSDGTADEAKRLDSVQWFGRWIQDSSPALGGWEPIGIIDTPSGVKHLEWMLQAIHHGVYI